MQTMNGKQVSEELAENMKEFVSSLSHVPSLAIVYVGHNKAIESFIKMKIAYGKKIGIPVVLFKYEDTLSQEDLSQEVKKIARDFEGVLVQLPLPKKYNTKEIVDIVPVTKDVDVLSEETKKLLQYNKTRFLPGVPGAIETLCAYYGVSFENKQVCVVGKGALVGMPVSTWLSGLSIAHVVYDKREFKGELLKDADIVITGIGVPFSIKESFLKEGVILFDAGTSEENGVLYGDIDPTCYSKASLYTPVPGGIGPLTVTQIFKNLLSNYGYRSKNI